MLSFAITPFLYSFVLQNEEAFSFASLFASPLLAASPVGSMKYWVKLTRIS